MLGPNGRANGDEAWARFLDAYSDLLLYAVRALAADQDGAMDRYAYVIEKIREQNCRRLRAFEVGGRSKFSTWLVVVARRLCVDFHRERYGRDRTGDDDEARASRRTRRNLVDLLADDLDLTELPASHHPSPADEVVRRERHAALGAAIESLDHRDRLLLQLRFESELPVAEITRVMSFPSQFHVYRQLKKVFAGLRRLLTDRGIDAALDG